MDGDYPCPRVYADNDVPCATTFEESFDTKGRASIETGIRINGVGDDAHELFIIQRPVPMDTMTADAGEKVWSFCKTARKPYDLVVSTILMRARILAGDAFTIGSTIQSKKQRQFLISEQVRWNLEF